MYHTFYTVLQIMRPSRSLTAAGPPLSCRLQQRSGGKVPVINKGDFWMPDSDEIVKLLEAEYPEPSMISSVPAEVSANFFPLFKGWLFAEPEELEQKMAAFLEVMSKGELACSVACKQPTAQLIAWLSFPFCVWVACYTYL